MDPIDMVLHCPTCGLQHIDAPEEPDPFLAFGPGMDRERWTNPPHRSHLCHGCSHIWRPADVPTNGVAAVKTKGSADSPLTSRRYYCLGPNPLEWTGKWCNYCQKNDHNDAECSCTRVVVDRGLPYVHLDIEGKI